MTRQDQLAFCTQCLKRSFKSDKGVICSLTNEQATFEVTCEHYEEDSKLVAKNIERNKLLEEKQLDRETWGLSLIGIKDLVFVGIIFLVLSVVIQGVLLFKFGLISLWPVLVFVLSIITIIKGVQRKKEEAKKKQTDILDDEI